MVNDNDVIDSDDSVIRGDRSDYIVRSYQDGVDVDQNKSDPLMNELNDDPVEMFGVPANELREELDKRDTDVVDADDPEDSDDMREEMESLDDNRD